MHVYCRVIDVISVTRLKLLRRSATIFPPALLDSVGIKNCYSRYPGRWSFLDKSKFDSTVSINYAVGSYSLLLSKNRTP